MVFGKDQKNMRELGRKGAISRYKKYGSNFTELWKNEEWRKEKIKKARETMTSYNKSMTKEGFSKHCSKAGKKSRERENKVSKRIKGKYEKIFQPFVVCDRIAIKNGKVVFIEIKKDKTDKLKPKQKEFRDLCNEMKIEYKIHYYK